MTRNLRLALAFVACTALVAAACGGEVTESGDDGAAAPTTQAPEAEPETAEPDATQPDEEPESEAAAPEPDDEPET